MARGDHLRIYRGGYYHHGIDLGDGSVVHLTTYKPAPPEGMVIRTGWKRFVFGEEEGVPFHEGVAFDRTGVDLWSFYKEKQVEIIPYYDYEKPFHVDQTCIIALSRVKREGYSLWGNNCEHFAQYCKTGKRASGQLDKAVNMFWKYAKFGYRYPAWFIGAPLMVIGKQKALEGLYYVHKLWEKPSNSIPLQSRHPFTTVAPLLLRMYTRYLDGNKTLHKTVSGNWSFWDGTNLIPIDPPPENPQFVEHCWQDEGGQIYISRQDGWFVSNPEGQWLALQFPESSVSEMHSKQTPVLRHAPTGALIAYLAAPESLQNLVDVMEEVSLRGAADAVTYWLLENLALSGSQEYTGQYREDWAYVQSAALWTLGMVLRGQFAGAKTEQMPSLEVIASILANENELPDVRIAALQAIQVLNCPQEDQIRRILEAGILSKNEEVIMYARRVLSGEKLII